MIVYYLGIPGSGKSYSGVNTIYNNFTDNKDAKRDLKKDYNNCYTNINEFKFDKCHDVYFFDFEVFYKQLEELHTMYKNKATDDALIEKAKEFNIYKTLFVLDECHQYFDVEKKVLVWWLTYHRHLYHDIILITQNLALVNSKYKPLAEAFYRAKPSSLTLNNKFFNYTYFTDSRMTKASRVNVKKVLKRKGVFELYHSGDSVDSKNVIKHFLLIALGLAVLLFALMYYFYGSKHNKIKEHTSHPAKVVPTEKRERKIVIQDNSTPDKKIDYSQKKFIVLNCSMSHCSNSNLDLPTKLLFKFEKMSLIHIFYKERISKYFTILYCSTNTDIYNFLSTKKPNNGANSENTQMLSNPTSLFTSK